jgi:NhaA family Na+:H+ antiporter
MKHRAKQIVKRLSRLEKHSAMLMVSFCILALLLSNLGPTAHIYESVKDAHLTVFADTNFAINLSVGEWVQDFFLFFFFLSLGLELKFEFTSGVLRNKKNAIIPVVAAFAGVLVPILIFFGTIAFSKSFNVGDAALGESGFDAIKNGWAIPTATDVAFSLAVLNLFLKGLSKNALRHMKSARTFLLTLAVVDDLIGIVIIAIFFTSTVDVKMFLLLAVVCTAIYILSRQNAHFISVLLVLLSILAWYLTYKSGIHPTIAGVLVGFLVPAKNKTVRCVVPHTTQGQGTLPAGLTPANSISANSISADSAPTAVIGFAHSKIHDKVCVKKYRYIAARILTAVNPFVNLVVIPVFVFFSIGTNIPSLLEVFNQGDASTYITLLVAIVLALILGKPIGILCASKVCNMLGIKHLSPLRTKDIVPVSILASIGFTVSFLLANLSFPTEGAGELGRAGINIGETAADLQVALAEQNTAKLGVLIASVLATILGGIVLKLHTAKLFKEDDYHAH